MNSLVEVLTLQDLEAITEDQKYRLTDPHLYEKLFNISDGIFRAHIKEAVRIKANEFGLGPNVARLLKEHEKAFASVQSMNTRVFNRITGLDYAESGKIKASIENFKTILLEDPYFQNKKICYNELTKTLEHFNGEEMAQWTDADSAEAKEYIESGYGIHNSEKFLSALRIIQNLPFCRYHPIKNAIEDLKWDGNCRIENFLTYTMKCENTAYTREVSRLIFAGGINRIYEPGCKFDVLPILIGTRQGEGKSTLVRWLALENDYFTELTTFEGREGIEAQEGAWICEIGELLALSRSKDIEGVKSFITRQKDKYRKPYDIAISNIPRQCIFIGTTNKREFLTDKTGNRRFFPVVVHQSGYELFTREAEIKEYIRQCWAEAKARYDNNNLSPVPNHALIADFQAAQNAAMEDDYRVGMITEWLKTNGIQEVCVLQLWQCALNDNIDTKPTKSESNEIAAIMNSLPGWEKAKSGKIFAKLGKQRYWFLK